MSISVLLDDDPLIANIWNISAKQAGIDLLYFDHIEKLLSHLSYLPTDCFFYLDFKLKENKTGEDVAAILFNQGFKEIYLTTGYPPEKLEKKSWIKKILNKNPPWSIPRNPNT